MERQENVDPISKDITIPALDGLLLNGTTFEPDPEQLDRGTILALPGVGYPRRTLRHLATWLAARGVRTIAVDYRGMFGSGGSRGVRSASLTRWTRSDAVGALRYVQDRYGAPALLAHSFGGQMIGLDPAFASVRSVAMIGSGFGQPDHYRGKMRAFVTLSWYLTLPVAAALLDRVPGWLGLGTPLPAGVAAEWSRWGRSPGWLLEHVRGAETLYREFPAPVLALRATDDPIAPPTATHALLDLLQTAPLEYLEVRPETVGMGRVGHAGLLRPQVSETVWPRILEHLSLQVAGSGTWRPWSQAMSRGA